MNLPSWARPGVRVECIKVVHWTNKYHKSPPDGGPKWKEVYVIEKAIAVRNNASGWALVLREYPGKSWKIEAFRPLIEKDLEMFREMLKSREREEELT